MLDQWPVYCQGCFDVGKHHDLPFSSTAAKSASPFPSRHASEGLILEFPFVFCLCLALFPVADRRDPYVRCRLRCSCLPLMPS